MKTGLYKKTKENNNGKVDKSKKTGREIVQEKDENTTNLGF